MRLSFVKLFTEQEKLHGSHLTEESFHFITDYIRVMIQRNKQGEYVEPQGYGSVGNRIPHGTGYFKIHFTVLQYLINRR